MAVLTIFIAISFLFYCANRAEKRREEEKSGDFALFIAYGSMMLIHLMMIFFGILTQLVGIVIAIDEGQVAIFDSPLTEAYLEAGIDLAAIDFSLINFSMIGMGMWVPSLIGLFFLIKRVRKEIAKLIPISAPNYVHAVALSLSVFVLTNLFVTLGFNLENLTGIISMEGVADAAENSDLLGAIWGQNIGFFLMSLIGVGWLTRRSWGETSERLKLEVPYFMELLIGFGCGIVAVIVISAVGYVVEEIGWGNNEVDALSEVLYGPFFSSIAGVLTVALAAAWGEETLFRGALQPRFGRILTAIIFALVHSNYGISFVTVMIFLLGIVLGYLRDRYNTTTAMITHATFNGTQALLAYYLIQSGVGF